MCDFNNKDKLRKIIKEKRKSIPDDLKNKYDNQISDIFIQSSLYRAASGILLYYPLAGEVNTLDILSGCRNMKIPAAFPVTDSENYSISFFTGDDFKKGLFNVIEPDIEKSTLADASKFNICILPGLSFNLYGARLGYGKGCYDRFLKDYPGVKIGLCYSGLLRDDIYMDSHDIYMDYIITENGVYDCRNITAKGQK